MMPSCDQIGVPIHFHSSTTSGSASLISSRILLRVSPRQSPSSAILFEMSSDADWPWLAPDFFMFSGLEVPDIDVISVPLAATVFFLVGIFGYRMSLHGRSRPYRRHSQFDPTAALALSGSKPSPS